MIRLVKFFCLLIVITPIILVVTLLFSLEHSPAAQSGHQPLTHLQVNRAKALLRQNDPRKLKKGQLKTTSLNESELKLLGTHLLSRLDGQFNVALIQNQINFTTSFKVPALQPNTYLNLLGELSVLENRINLEHFQIGSLTLPSTLTEQFIRLILKSTLGPEPFDKLKSSIIGLRSENKRLHIRYQWEPELLELARSSIVSEEHQQRLYHYRNQLNELLSSTSQRTLSLDTLVNPLFSEARHRSSSENAHLENRAVLMVLGQYLSGRGEKLLFPEKKITPYPKKRITLLGRVDYAQHFIISAAMSATGNDKISDLIGLQKELEDSEKGSGFSFTDLAADRAGNYLGKISTLSAGYGDKFQTFMTTDKGERRYMVSVSGLPEGLRGKEFKNRFGSTQTAQFKEVETIIDQRIRNTPLRHQMGAP